MNTPDSPIITTATHPQVDWSKPFLTENFDLAVGLATIGIPWKVKREATVMSGNHLNDRDRYGFRFAGSCQIARGNGQPPLHYNTHHLAKALIQGDLERTDPEHPLCYALQSLLNRRAMLNHTRDTKPVWHFKKAGAPITAVVNDQHEASLDTIHRFFKRSGRHAGKPNPLT